jgi:hypothetical protein
MTRRSRSHDGPEKCAGITAFMLTRGRRSASAVLAASAIECCPIPIGIIPSEYAPQLAGAANASRDTAETAWIAVVTQFRRDEIKRQDRPATLQHYPDCRRSAAMTKSAELIAKPHSPRALKKTTAEKSTASVRARPPTGTVARLLDGLDRIDAFFMAVGRAALQAYIEGFAAYGAAYHGHILEIHDGAHEFFSREPGRMAIDQDHEERLRPVQPVHLVSTDYGLGKPPCVPSPTVVPMRSRRESGR